MEFRSFLAEKGRNSLQFMAWNGTRKGAGSLKKGAKHWPNGVPTCHTFGEPLADALAVASRSKFDKPPATRRK